MRPCSGRTGVGENIGGPIFICSATDRWRSWLNRRWLLVLALPRHFLVQSVLMFGSPGPSHWLAMLVSAWLDGSRSGSLAFQRVRWHPSGLFAVETPGLFLVDSSRGVLCL